jgi:uncharacterized protein involved in exopolysaccharide biosynthesis
MTELEMKPAEGGGKDLIALLRRYAWLLTILVGGFCSAAVFVTVQSPVIYRSEAILHLNFSEAGDLLTPSFLTRAVALEVDDPEAKELASITSRARVDENSTRIVIERPGRDTSGLMSKVVQAIATSVEQGDLVLPYQRAKDRLQLVNLEVERADRAATVVGNAVSQAIADQNAILLGDLYGALGVIETDRGAALQRKRQIEAELRTYEEKAISAPPVTRVTKQYPLGGTIAVGLIISIMAFTVIVAFSELGAVVRTDFLTARRKRPGS